MFCWRWWIIKWFMYILNWFGGILICLSIMQNTFLSPMVRIQSEKEHKVISDGLYSKVRHPMYSGLLLFYVGASIFLESFTACILMIFLFLIVLWRVKVEERTLENELEGYIEYEKKVKARFVPYIC